MVAVRRLLVPVLVPLVALLGCSGDRTPPPSQGHGIAAGTLRIFRSAHTQQALSSSPEATPAPLPSETPRPPPELPEVVRPRVLSGPVHPLPQGEQLVPGEVLVRLDTPHLSAQAALAGLQVEGYTAAHLGYGARDLHRIRYRGPDGRQPTGEESRALVAALEGRPGVRAATLERVVFPAALPNDPFYPPQWHYRAINLPAAWDLGTSSPDVVVAVVDSGTRPHRDLQPKLLPGYDFISDPQAAGDGDGRDPDPTDPGGDLPQESSHWHGTHVAGTVGAVTNNRAGVAGVAWQARVLPVRALTRTGLLGDVLAAMEWAVGLEVPGVPRNAHPAQVVNLSLGTDAPPDPVVQETFSRVVATGAVVVVVAGNENTGTANKLPCNLQGVVCVGASRLSGQRASYSNFGPQVDVMAPGGESSEDLDGNGYPDGVLSTFFDAQGTEAYGFLSGTSMAAPHVSGVVALMKALAPGLSPAQVEQLLKDTAAGGFGCGTGCGAGLVNAQAALLRAAGRTAPDGPAQLALTTDTFVLQDATADTLPLINTGGGPLRVTARFVARTPGASVTFPLGPTVTLAPGSMAPLLLAGDTTGLAPGDYDGVLHLDTDVGEPRVLTVRIRVPVTAAPLATLVLVQQDGAGAWTVARTAEVSPEAGYAFQVEVPEGTYFLLAAVDENGNGQLFEEGERSGIYPTLDNPRPVTFSAGQTTSGLDFTLMPAPPVEGAPGLRVGTPCTSDAACPGGLCDTTAGGYCTQECGSAPCPANAACGSLGGAPRCLAVCSAPQGGQSSCLEQQVCARDAVGGGVCLPRCDTGVPCSGGTCNPTTGYCE